MENIEIMNMRPVTPGYPDYALALFDAMVEGFKLNECLITVGQPERGHEFHAHPPRRATRALIKLPERLWFPFVNAAVEEYRDWLIRRGNDEPDDAGMRRFLSAEAEACEIAGL